MMRRLMILLIASAAVADDAAPLAVSPPAELIGDGRAVASIDVTGGRPPVGKPLPVPEVARVTCTGASSLAALGNGTPGVLAPFAGKPAKLSCIAKVRDEEKTFDLAVRPPPPGLYAAAGATDGKSTAKEHVLEPLAWDGTNRTAPGRLQIAASEGKASVRDGKIVLEVSGNAPRLVAIAMVDGDRLGAGFVPVTGVTTIPVESEPGATVSVWIAGRWFGPVRTRGKIASVPIEVPPGVTDGVARSTGKAGYVTDAVTDLKIPDRPRIAAVPSTRELRIAGGATIAIALAGADGRPAAAAATPSGTARAGKVGVAKSLGNGLWSMPYTAPDKPGPDRVTIKVDGDKRAGAVELDFEIKPGNVASIELDVARGPHEPGAPFEARARVLDRNGNAVRDAAVSATLGTTTLEAIPGDPFTLRGRVPERVPDALALEVAAEGITAKAPVVAGGSAATASISSTIDGRTAAVELAVRDRFGNLVPQDRFEVSIDGGRLDRIARGRSAFRVNVSAESGTATARVTVRADGRVLAESSLEFEPPASAIVFGAWVSGGWIDNLGVLAGPRGGAGLAIRRGLSTSAELALLLGFEGTRFADTTELAIDGTMRTADRSIVGLGGSAALRARWRLTRRFGLAIGAGVVPTRARVKFRAGSDVDESYDEVVLGLRGQLHADTRLGPGRLFLGGTYGIGKLEDGVVVGKIDGLAAIAGYEYWFASVGW